MRIKKMVATASLALTLAATGSIVAYANIMSGSPYDFDMESSVGSPHFSGPERKKTDGDADILVTDGIPSTTDVTFRVRNYDYSYATNYVEVSYWDMYEGVWVDMPYLSGMGETGERYYLATSLDANNYVTVTDVKGYWNP